MTGFATMKKSLGCQDTVACNFSVDATDDDGSCLYNTDLYPERIL